MKTIDEGRDLSEEPQWLGVWQCPHCGRTVELEPGDNLTALSQTSYADMDGDFVSVYREAGSFLGFFWDEGIRKVRCHNCDKAGMWIRVVTGEDVAIAVPRDKMAAPDCEPAETEST